MRRAMGAATMLVLTATVAGATGLVAGPEWQALSPSGQTEFVQTALAEAKTRWKTRASSAKPGALTEAYNQCFATETFDAAWVEQARASVTRYYAKPTNDCHEASKAVHDWIDYSCRNQLDAAAQKGGFLLVPPARPHCAAP